MAEMAIGPVLPIGGNEVQMTAKGKVQITNAQGKIKILSADQFKKQLVKNADKIERGEDFEFKKGHKKAAVAASAFAALAAVAAGLGIAVHKKVLKPANIAKDAKLFEKALGKVQDFAHKAGSKIEEYSIKAKDFAVENFNKLSAKLKECMPKRAPKVQEPAQQ